MIQSLQNSSLLSALNSIIDLIFTVTEIHLISTFKKRLMIFLPVPLPPTVHYHKNLYITSNIRFSSEDLFKSFSKTFGMEVFYKGVNSLQEVCGLHNIWSYVEFSSAYTHFVLPSFKLKNWTEMCVSCKNSQSHIKMQIDNTSFRSHHLNRKYVFSPFYNFKLLEKWFRWTSDQRPSRDIPTDMNHSANRPTVDVAQRNCTSSHLSPHDKLKAWSLSPSKAKWISFYMTINPQ